MSLRLLLDAQFVKWARRRSVSLSDDSLRCAADEIKRGLVDARLGGFIVKKRIGRKGAGKSGGFRTIVAYRSGNRMVFLYGFAKNEDDNISARELKVLVRRGDVYMNYSSADIQSMLDQQLLVEVKI